MFIMGPECAWIRHVDDVLVVASDDVNLDDKLEKWNSFDQKKKKEQRKRGRFIYISNSRHADSIVQCLHATGSNVPVVSRKKTENLSCQKAKKSESMLYTKFPVQVNAKSHMWVKREEG